jgi:hypothetical protein
VQVLNAVQYCPRSRDSRIRYGVNDHIVWLGHGISLVLGAVSGSVGAPFGTTVSVSRGTGQIAPVKSLVS